MKADAKLQRDEVRQLRDKVKSGRAKVKQDRNRARRLGIEMERRERIRLGWHVALLLAGLVLAVSGLAKMFAHAREEAWALVIAGSLLIILARLWAFLEFRPQR